MHEEETIKENRQLKHEIAQLKEYIRDLESRLAKYENAHTTPSLKRGPNRKIEENRVVKGTHKGVTRPYAKPDRQVDVTADRCPDCGTELGNPIRIESRIIEEIPEPQPIKHRNRRMNGPSSFHIFEKLDGSAR